MPVPDGGSPGDAGTSPAGYNRLDASGDTSWFGWPKSDAVQTKIDEWYAAPDLAAEKRIIGELNQAAMEDVVHIPLGFWKNLQAWRTDVSGIVGAPFPAFWEIPLEPLPYQAKEIGRCWWSAVI
jgi:peptide/nickel transport system substrate-binding protein